MKNKVGRDASIKLIPQLKEWRNKYAKVFDNTEANFQKHSKEWRTKSVKGNKSIKDEDEDCCTSDLEYLKIACVVGGSVFIYTLLFSKCDSSTGEILLFSGLLGLIWPITLLGVFIGLIMQIP